MTLIACKFWEVQFNEVFTRDGRRYRKSGADCADLSNGTFCAERLQPDEDVFMSPTAWNRVGYGLTSFRRLRPYATFLLSPTVCLLHDPAAQFGRFYMTLDRAALSNSAYYLDGPSLLIRDLTRIELGPSTPVINVRAMGAPRNRGCVRCLGVHWVIQRQPAAANKYVVLPCPVSGSAGEACRAAARCGLKITQHATMGVIQDVSLPFFLRARRTFAMRVTVTHHADFEDPYETILSRFKKSMQGTNCDIKYESLGAVLEVEAEKPAPPRERAIQLD
jgi:hypothetical protein